MAKSNLLDPTLEKQLKGHRNTITALTFNPNEQQLASSSYDGSILLWDLENRHGNLRSFRFHGHDMPLTDVAFSPSGKYMASASFDTTVRVWVPTVTGSSGVFKAHSTTVRSVQFSPDGLKILTASDDKIIKLWSSDKYKFISSFVGHTNWVRCARMSNDGSVIASCSDDKTTKLWNANTGEIIHSYKDQKGYGHHLAWHPSGCYVAVATSQGNVKLYDIRTHNLVQYYNIHSDAVTQVAFHPSGSYILTSSKDGKMKVLDLLEGHPLFTLMGHEGEVNAVTFSPSGESFATAGEDKVVFIWKTNFTELANDTKENLVENSGSSQRLRSQPAKPASGKRRNQEARPWHLCYHSSKYPVSTFEHVDEESGSTHSTISRSVFQEPNANSTVISSENEKVPTVIRESFINNATNSLHLSGKCDEECPFNSVGHISHIPRTPPTPATFSIPNIDKANETNPDNNEDMYGLIKLKETDVCYTNGTITWVGRKRTYPINSGFKILDDIVLPEPLMKRTKGFDNTYSIGKNNLKECDCADVLPTVHALVDHLNALHEAVDLVDLRLNTLEDVINKSNVQ